MSPATIRIVFLSLPWFPGSLERVFVRSLLFFSVRVGRVGTVFRSRGWTRPPAPCPRAPSSFLTAPRQSLTGGWRLRF